MSETAASEKELFYGTGKRKTAIAKVWLKRGNGEIKINGKDFAEIYDRGFHRYLLLKPLEITQLTDKVDINVKTYSGGISGQVGAISLGISRALINFNPELRKLLREEDCLTRDPRMKERKKYGQKRARKRFQYSKR